MSRFCRDLDNQALQSICDAARELPNAQRSAFLRVCCERFRQYQRQRTCDRRESIPRHSEIGDAGVFTARIHGSKNKLSLSGGRFQMKIEVN
jgi:hypothetical protein